MFFGEKENVRQKVKLTNTDEFIAEVNEHTHPPSQAKVEVAKIRTAIKRKAETTHETPQQILAVVLQGISVSAAVTLPPLNNLRKNIRVQIHN